LFIYIGLLHFHLLLLNFVQPFPPIPAAPSANAVAAWMVNGNPSSSSQSLAALTASSLPGPSDRGITLNTLELIDHKMRRLRDPQSVEEVLEY